MGIERDGVKAEVTRTTIAIKAFEACMENGEIWAGNLLVSVRVNNAFTDQCSSENTMVSTVSRSWGMDYLSEISMALMTQPVRVVWHICTACALRARCFVDRRLPLNSEK